MTRLLAPVVCALVVAGAGGARAEACAAGPDRDLAKEAPQLTRDARFGAFFRAFAVREAHSELVIDERHVRFSLVAQRAPRADLALALPAPFAGAVALELPEVAPGACVDVELVLFDDALRAVSFPDAKVAVTGVVKAKGRVHRAIELQGRGLTLTPTHLTLGESAPGLYLGPGVPSPAALFEADGDLEGYLSSLRELEVELSPSVQARFDFLRAEQRWRRELTSILPRARQEQIARFREEMLPPGERPLLRFWQDLLGAHPSSSDDRARLLVDDEVDEVWVDGVPVYVRGPGASPSVEVALGSGGARVWIVSHGAGRPVTVHDTRAVLRKGELYSVTKTVLQHVGPGTRRECVRVEGALPGKEKIYWRDLGTTPGPVLGSDDAYRPPFDASERFVTIVSKPRGGPPFPPVPLVYSYTHEGTYRWRLSPEGPVTLELLDADPLCPKVVKDPLVRP